MEMITKVFVVIGTVSAFTATRRESSEFLRREVRRLPLSHERRLALANDEMLDDLEIECVENRCTFEELDEVYDYETGYFKVKNCCFCCLKI